MKHYSENDFPIIKKTSRLTTIAISAGSVAEDLFSGRGGGDEIRSFPRFEWTQFHDFFVF